MQLGQGVSAEPYMGGIALRITGCLAVVLDSEQTKNLRAMLDLQDVPTVEILNTSLSPAIKNALRRRGVYFLTDLMQLTDKEVSLIVGIGDGAMQMIRFMLKNDYDLSLK